VILLVLLVEMVVSLHLVLILLLVAMVVLQPYHSLPLVLEDQTHHLMVLLLHLLLWVEVVAVLPLMLLEQLVVLDMQVGLQLMV
jgi:hypothetical protein